jgi:hypothetical protein
MVIRHHPLTKIEYLGQLARARLLVVVASCREERGPTLRSRRALARLGGAAEA